MYCTYNITQRTLKFSCATIFSSDNNDKYYYSTESV